ncbi:hypothetical protein [Pseudoduganella namucuonensis]|uniref:Uncharacterized protein n=1 Tax=Pseudoduganella namucuonensis TaxID=1035707 RepID=A0A1I7LNB9_9BURK|nr:hypothetical protein [Pseudoduganella namucuonensis]SFV11197.1 hypothetical protein SAMN05216552_103356 [Pseudoduganella namucuonensis]
MRFFIDMRKNEAMALAIDQAIASLTLDSHTNALRIMACAGVPLAVVARVVFAKDQFRGRRRDFETAQLFDRALAIAKLYGPDDADAYFKLKNFAAALVVRVLSDGPHRGDLDGQVRWIDPPPDMPANQLQPPVCNPRQPYHADATARRFARDRASDLPGRGRWRLRRACPPCAALADAVSRFANWLMP